MKKRMVEVSEGEVLSEKRFEDLYNHARNSGIWYAQNLPKTTHELKQKMYEKGYPKGTVFVERESGREEVNIVDKAIQSLVDAYYVDDEAVAERFAESRRRRGYGKTRAVMELRRKGLDEDLIERVIETAYDDIWPDVEAFVKKTFEAERKRTEDPWKLKQKVVQKVAGRGWDLDGVFDLVDELMDE